MILFEKQIRLLNLLILTEGPVSGHVLGKECGQSLNTLKKEIKLLNDQLENEALPLPPVCPADIRLKFWILINSSASAANF